MSEQYEIRYCENCLTRTKQFIQDSDRLRNPRGYASFKCQKCGRIRRMRLLRPSAESSY
jgi:RNase P subunit RPR2